MPFISRGTPGTRTSSGRELGSLHWGWRICSFQQLFGQGHLIRFSVESGCKIAGNDARETSRKVSFGAQFRFGPCTHVYDWGRGKYHLRC